MVLDATGTPVPLATQAAADALKNNDPVWCPGITKPGGSGCTASDGSVTTITQLITAVGTLGLSTPTAGTIYFEYTNPVSPYNISDASFSSNVNNLGDLVIQGGWNGGTTTLGTFGLSGSSYFSVPLSVTNWNGDVTLNDITITGVTTTTGLLVTTAATTAGKGNITLHNVKSNNNKTGGIGADLDNTAGSGHGNIMVDFDLNGSSEFNTNTYGLVALSNGNINLIDVTADDNEYDGAGLDNSTGSGDIYVDFNLSNNQFNGNGEYGLHAASAGAITLNSVNADGNSYDGAYLDNTFSGGPSAINVNRSTFGWAGYGNVQNGLEVYSNGSISLDSVTADYNNYDGTYLSTSGSDSFGHSIYIDTSADFQGGVGLSGNPSDFSNNKDEQPSGTTSPQNPSGLEAYGPGDFYLGDVTANTNSGNGLTATSSNGWIDLWGAKADSNGGAGAVLNNAGNNMVDVAASFNSNIDFSSNYNDGLDVTSTGEIDLYDVVADSNGQSGAGAGAVLNNAAGDGYGVYIDTVYSPNNEFSSNYNDGLDVTSGGEIDLYDVVADYNGQSLASGAGAVLGNSGAPVGTVTIDPSTFNNNWNDGLDVTSSSAITLTDVTADNNGQSGLGGSGAVLDNTSAPAAHPQDITVNMSSGTIYNDFSNNYNNGLKALSLGNIALYNVDAYDNGWGSGAGGVGDGAYLENDYLGASGDIYVSFGYFGLNNSSPTFYGNGSNGLEAYSNSSIDLELVEANWNHEQGAILHTTGLVSGAATYVDQNFTVSPPNYPVSSFDYNQGHGSVANPAGLQVYGAGDINIWNVDAECNGTSDCSSPSSGSPTYGMMLDNTSGSGSISVDDSFLGQFDFNSADGIEAFSNGTITLTDVVASNNIGGDGAYLNDFSGTTASTIKVDNSHILGGDGFNNNAGNGLKPIRIAQSR